MSVQCALTKRVIFIPCRQTVTGRRAARLLFGEVVRHHGLPLRIISDRDPRFMAEFWSSLFKVTGTKLSFTFPYDAKPNGSVERAHRTLGQAMRCFCEKVTEWQKWLHVLEFSINNTVNESTGYSPFYLDMGRNPMTPGLVNVPVNSAEATLYDPVAFVQAHREIPDIARDTLLEARKRAANDAARAVRDPGYAVGDEVLLATRTFKKSKHGKKLRKRWEGPYRVVSVYKNGVEVDLSTSAHTRLSTTWSNAFVKRYQREEQEQVAPEC